MQTVKLRRDDLLVVVKKNLEEHRAMFEATLEKYHQAVVAELEKSLADARAGKRYRHMIRLDEPVDQSRDYKRVILMLEMTPEEIIELSSQEFSCFVQDDWSWKQQFTLTASNYGVKARGYDD